jgi:Esterase-like activity of phytase
MMKRFDCRLRQVLAILVALGLGAGTWLRSPVLPPSHEMALTLTPLSLSEGCCRAGPLRLIGAWQLSSPNETFGGYSALVRPVPGRLLALSDRGYYLDFAQPGAAEGPLAMGQILPDKVRFKDNRDVESASYDPGSQLLWIAQEGRNAVARHHLPDLDRQSFREVPELKSWPQNTGPEAMVRLTDGRFIVLCECTTGWFQGGHHPAFLFTGDPSEGATGRRLTFLGIDGYSPTDMAQLPDGRVLVLVRRLRWPMPARFAVKVLLADPAEIATDGTWQASEVADISAPWPVDNYEGLAIERTPDGRLIGWIISDENGAVTQRALLLKVEIDVQGMPAKRAPGSPGRP